MGIPDPATETTEMMEMEGCENAEEGFQSQTETFEK